MSDTTDTNQVAVEVERPKKALLTPEMVREIQAEYATGKSKQALLARKYSVSQGRISQIVNKSKETSNETN